MTRMPGTTEQNDILLILYITIGPATYILPKRT